VKRRQVGSVAHRLKGQPEMDAIYRGYKKQLEALKAKYYNVGLQPRARRQPVRKRLTNPNQDALYQGWLIEFRKLREKYWNAGLKLKGFEPRKRRSSTTPKRLPAVILPYSVGQSQPQRRMSYDPLLPRDLQFPPSPKMQQPTPEFKLPSPRTAALQTRGMSYEPLFPPLPKELRAKPGYILPALEIPRVEHPSNALRVRKRTGPTLIKLSRSQTPKRGRQLEQQHNYIQLLR